MAVHATTDARVDLRGQTIRTQ